MSQDWMDQDVLILDGGLSNALDRAEALITASVLLARDARDEMLEDLGPDRPGGRRLLVAASVGPYGAVLADGSEYRGRYGLSYAQLRDFHPPRLEPWRTVMSCRPSASTARRPATCWRRSGPPFFRHRACGRRLSQQELAGSTSWFVGSRSTEGTPG